MTDKKTIQEALAEVQHYVELNEFAPNPPTTGQKIKSVAKTVGKALAKGGAVAVGAPAVGAGVGFLAGKAVEKAATGTETGRNIGKWIGDNVPGAKTAADALKPVGDEIRRTFGAEVPKRASDTTPAAPAPSASDAPKAETPKMTFNQAYAKARDLAKSAGKDPNVAQFKFDRGGGEKVYQAAATKKDYVPTSKQFKVDVGSAPKAETPSEPVKVKSTTEPPMPANVGPDATKFTKPESESGGKKKMSEENINELSAFGAEFARQMKAKGPGGSFNWNGKQIALKYASPSKTSSSSGPQGAPGLRGPQAGKGEGPVARVRDLSTPLPPRRPEQGPPAPKAGSGNETLPVGSGTAPRPNVGEPGGQTSAINAPQTKPPASGGSSNPPTTSGNQTPSGTASFMSQNAREPEYESGKKKKMSEDTNPLIASFLALQAKNPSNMFEAAKKLTKKQDEKLDVVDDDKIDAKDFAALRAGKKKVDEASLPTMAKPSANANVRSVTTDFSAPDRPAVTSSPKGYRDPSTPTVPYSELPKPGNAAGDVLDKAKGALDKKGVKEETEEVTFSQAEIDHINSFFLEASVAPTRPEVATGADSTSDKMSQNDVTGTSTESGKRKVKEEVELDEDLGSAAAIGAALAGTGVGTYLGNKLGNKIANWKKKKVKKPVREETLQEGRPKKNPTPETTERDPRKHIQVIAGRAAAGNTLDFPHNDGSKSKITPAMGRKITSHLNGLKPADRQSAVNAMHASAEGLKV